MWERLWIALALALASNVHSQHTDTLVEDSNGGSFEWGWQMEPPGESATSVGHYFVKLPQSEQHVKYAADSTGYHGALALNTSDGETVHTANVALGQRALQLNEQQLQTDQQQVVTQRQPPDLYYFQQRYTPLDKSHQIIQLVSPSSDNLFNNYYVTPVYNLQSRDHFQNDNEKEKVKEIIPQDHFTENDENVLSTPIVQVFKDVNCSKGENTEHISIGLDRNDDKTTDYTDTTSFNVGELNGDFGKKVNKSLNYKGRVRFSAKIPKAEDRSERLYYKSVLIPETLVRVNISQDGIDKLVASTQDLISNEDLLYINHAAEKQVNDQSEDFIKPRSRYTVRQKTYSDQETTNQITVKAKFENVRDSPKEYTNNFNFATPIIVADSSFTNEKQQVLNNLISTMIPYIEDGYELIGIRNNIKENKTHVENNPSSVTHKGIGQNYLTPITVALRLLNANENKTFDTEDHVASDSELISNTVENPQKETTVVEIQESIPVDITHINDVEVHEYLEDGRSNNVPYNFAKTLYHKYLDVLESSKKIQDNMNKILSKYEANYDYENIDETRNETVESTEHLDSSEDLDTENEPEQSASQRTEYIRYLNRPVNTNQKIIQPIIIEKEIPVAKFVNRYIEKEVRVPERVEVRVPVDRPVPVAIPVEKVIEKPVEVTKYIDRPYPVEVPRPYPVQVPYPIEQMVYIDRPVHVPFAVEKVVEKPVIHPVPVPTPVGVPVQVPIPIEHKVIYPIAVEKPIPFRVEVEKPVHIDHIIEKQIPVPHPIEKQIPVPYEKKVPVLYPVERKVHVPVEKIVEKPVTVTKYIEKPIHVNVPVPHPVAVPVRVPQPYPVDRIIEKRVPYPVDRIVEKQVPVKVPFPVEKIVEKIVEKPILVTKYVDKPYTVEKRVPYPVERIVEKSVPYPVQVPVEVKVPVYGKHVGQESKHYPRYVALNQNYAKKTEQPVLSQYQQYLREKERLNSQMNNNIYGNKYATSFQHINNTTNDEYQNKLVNILKYLTNNHKGSYNNYSNNQNLNNLINKHANSFVNNDQNVNRSNKNYFLEVKMRRNDREPKLTNLRIEYGGFKPPLIPSTEIDLDGIPINNKE